MKKESCGHSLKVPSCITLQSETARKTHLPQVAITGTMDISDGKGLWPQLSLQTASWPVKQLSPCRRWNGRMDLQKDSGVIFQHFGSTALASRDKLVAAWGQGWWQCSCTWAGTKWETPLNFFGWRQLKLRYPLSSSCTAEMRSLSSGLGVSKPPARHRHWQCEKEEILSKGEDRYLFWFGGLLNG